MSGATTRTKELADEAVAAGRPIAYGPVRYTFNNKIALSPRP